MPIIYFIYTPATDEFLVYAASWSDLLPSLLADAARDGDAWRVSACAATGFVRRIRAAGYAVSGLEREEDCGAWLRLLLETVDKPYRSEVFTALLRTVEEHEMRALADAYERASR